MNESTVFSTHYDDSLVAVFNQVLPVAQVTENHLRVDGTRQDLLIQSAEFRLRSWRSTDIHRVFLVPQVFLGSSWFRL